MSNKAELVEAVRNTWAAFSEALAHRGRYPIKQFNAFFAAVRAYADAAAGETMIHREVASHVNGLREFLAVGRRRVPGRVLHDADRLECILFCGYDPHFEGEEPPGL